MTTFADLPAIPVSQLSPAALTDALSLSFRRYGFAVVAEHGIDQGVIDRAYAASAALFALPEDAKRRYHLAGTGGVRGYTPFGVETAKGASHHDLKEFWHVGRELPADHRYRSVMTPNLWPAEVAGFRESTLALYDALDQLGRRLLSALAPSLGLSEDWFTGRIAEGNSILRLLHYPPVSLDSPHVRAGAHEDINVITLLLGADEAGLELLDRRDNSWLTVAAPPGTIVINIGDMLQRLTNHVLPSTSHRVVNPAPERRAYSRYSMPFFLHFEPEVEIRSLPACVSDANPDRYPEPITANEYLLQRLAEIRLIG